MSSRWSSDGSTNSHKNARPRKGRPAGYIPPSFRVKSKLSQDSTSVKGSTNSTTASDEAMAPNSVPPHLQDPKAAGVIKATETIVTQSGAEPTVFACGHPMCIAKFKTEIRLKEHKFTTHDYCQRCDIDFEDDVAHMLHKLSSEDHIACKACGQDFNTSEGRDHHFRQNHITDQEIRCRACLMVFTRGGGLLHHMEMNLCKGMLDKNKRMVSSKILEKAREDKVKYLRYLSELGLEDDVGSVGSSAGESVGGVRLPWIVDKHEHYIDDYPALATVTGRYPSEPDSEFHAEAANFPPLGIEQENEGTQSVTVKLESMSVKSEVSGSDPTANKLPVNRSADAKVGNSRPEQVSYVPPVWPSEEKKFAIRLEAREFRTILGTYKCPFPTCTKSFKSEGAWNGHVNSPAHKGNDNRCPLCLRVFHSATALIQHVESPTERCAVRSTRVYSSVVSMVSGGFLEVAGEHDDGTAKFESQTPPDYPW